jgi:L-gulonolactone oxidase
VKAVGTRHSVTDTICTNGIPVSMIKLNSAILNDDGSSTFGAGIILEDALKFLQTFNLSLIHMPSYCMNIYNEFLICKLRFQVR